MASKFIFQSLERNSHAGVYLARVLFKGHKGYYEITTNAHFRYCHWMGNGDPRVSVLDQYDCGFETFPLLKIKGLTKESERDAKGLQREIGRFIAENYRVKPDKS